MGSYISGIMYLGKKLLVFSRYYQDKVYITFWVLVIIILWIISYYIFNNCGNNVIQGEKVIVEGNAVVLLMLLGVI